MKARLIFTVCFQCGESEWAQEYKTFDIDLPADVAEFVGGKWILKGVELIKEGGAE